MTLSVTCLGAAREVTGSMHLLRTPHGTLLIDCGLFQGRRAESRARNCHLPREAVEADALVLTHAHIDHSGSIPTLVRSGFRGAIWCTPATRDLCAHMLRDSARIQESDAEFLNRKLRDDPGFEPVEPIYTEADAVRALGRFIGVPYHTGFAPLPGVNARFLEAGHILGSAQVQLDIAATPGGRGKRRATHATRVVFSGDLGRSGLPILRDPEMPERPGFVFMESTYGARAHGSVDELLAGLERVIQETVARGGKVIVPAFAVGRTQELLYALNQLHRAGRIPELPVFIDSPLATNVTEVFKAHPDCYDDETRAFVEDHGDPFTFKAVRYVESREESMRLNDLREPAVIISASGMCEAGRILHHLRNTVEDDRNTILIVGFMAQHTLGRRLLERRPQVRILGVMRDLNARVVVMNGFSAHADQHDLRAYALACRGARRIHLVHGEPEQQEPLRDQLLRDGLDVVIPSARQELPLE